MAVVLVPISNLHGVNRMAKIGIFILNTSKMLKIRHKDVTNPPRDIILDSYPPLLTSLSS